MVEGMPNYQCQIGTADGRIVSKEYQSTGKSQLRVNLEAQGFHVFRIRRRPFALLRHRGSGAGRLSSQRFLSFNQELLALLRSGLPILQIFDTQLEQMEAGPFRDVISEIREEIRSGSSLSEAFSKFPRTFQPLYIAALKAGERTGDLSETLTRFLAYQKRVEAIRAKVRSASFYPLLLTTAAVAVVSFLMVYVVPRFTEIYADAEVELPLMTRVLISLANLIGHYWYLALGGLIGALLLARTLVRGSRGRLWVARLQLRLPFFGALARDYALSAFNRTLSTI